MDTQFESELLLSRLSQNDNNIVSTAFSSWLDTLISKANLTSTLQSIKSQSSGKSQANSGGGGGKKAQEIKSKLEAINSLNYLAKMELIRQYPLSSFLASSSSPSSSPPSPQSASYIKHLPFFYLFLFSLLKNSIFLWLFCIFSLFLILTFNFLKK